MIRASQLTKRYGDRVAVAGIDLDVRPGRVTGFLGPNGAGKSTTMRMMLGLDRPTSGTITVNGHAYVDSPAPLREVGCLLDAGAIAPGRSARDHLRWLAASNRIPRSRVAWALAEVGLTSVATQRAGSFSLGMRQRLGIAGALLGDPPVVVLDEPVNGLDPQGIRWVRTLARSLAQEGRTVFVSSHLMSEMALMADHLVVIGRGAILADCSMADFLDANATHYVRLRTPDLVGAEAVLNARGVRTERVDDALHVSGLDASAVGEAIAAAGIVLHELTPVTASLEDAFIALTSGAVEYQAQTTTREPELEGATR